MSALSKVMDNIASFLAPKQVWSIARAFTRIPVDVDGHIEMLVPKVSMWTGSIRSGKTVASLLAWLIYVATASRGGELVVIGRTRESIGRNIFGPLMDPTLFGPLAKHVSYTTGAPTAQILGRTVHVLGASDRRAENVLRGLTCAGAYVDEATLISQEFWTQLLGRMSVPGAQLFATTNPDGPSHWLKKHVVDRAEALGYVVFEFRLEDNIFLDRAFVARVRREYVGLFYDRFILGKWTVAEGSVYDQWNPARHVITASDMPEMTRVICFGIDYGDQHATRGYLLGIGPDMRTGHTGTQRLYVLDEWSPGGGIMGEKSAHMKRWLATRPKPAWGLPDFTAVDSAALAFKTQIFRDGQPGVMNAQKNVLPGIQTVASLLALDKLVVSDTCAHLIERLPGYVWDPKATARGETAPIKADDDEVDALRYAVYTSRGSWRDLIDIAPAMDSSPGSTPEATD